MAQDKVQGCWILSVQHRPAAKFHGKFRERGHSSGCSTPALAHTDVPAVDPSGMQKLVGLLGITSLKPAKASAEVSWFGNITQDRNISGYSGISQVYLRKNIEGISQSRMSQEAPVYWDEIPSVQGSEGWTPCLGTFQSEIN